MKVTEYCDALNLEIRLTYYPNQNGRWTASFVSCEVKESPDAFVLSSAYGDGRSPEGAIAAYVERIKGRILVVDAMREGVRTYAVPKSLEA